MADQSLAGLVNVLAASQAGVNGAPVGGAPLQQLVQRLGGWATQPGVPVQMHGLPASFMDHLNSGGTRTYPSGAFGLGGGGGTPTPPPNVINPGLGTGGQIRPPGSNPVVPPPFIGGGGELRIPNTGGVIPRTGGAEPVPTPTPTPTNTNPTTGEQTPWATIPEGYSGPPVDSSWLAQLANTPPSTIPEGFRWAFNPATRPTQQQQMIAAGAGSTYGPVSKTPAGMPKIGTSEFNTWVSQGNNHTDFLEAQAREPQATKQAGSLPAPESGETFFAYVLRTAPQTGFPLGSMGSIGLQAQPKLDKGYSFQETLDRIMRPTAYMSSSEYQQHVADSLRLIGRG
jgi:hypothetical protein